VGETDIGDSGDEDRSAVRHPVLLATRSGGKLHELQPLFAAAGFTIRQLHDEGIEGSPDEDLIEAFDTFEENALAKARYFHALCGGPVVADDSGLMLEALGGEPGVRSKRWSGRGDIAGRALDEANNAKLLESLRGAVDRRARYVCAAAYVDDVRELVRLGETAGVIVDSRRGVHGFGYDPFFLSAELGVTFGEASREAKEGVSHRGRAFRALIDALRVQR
jgi:XTP/dITP diphosphohydrolase